MDKNNGQTNLDELAIPFMNQEETVNNILSPHAPQYHLIDAPAGYGKTELLKELERRFQEKFWCAYLPAAEHQTLRKLIRAMFKKFNLAEPGGDEKLLELLISTLGNQLKQKRQEEPMKEGLVLLIDLGNLEKEATLTLINSLLKFFIPRLQLNLTFDEFFRARSSRFRVVLAGRHLAGLDEVKSSSLPLQTHKLALFSYNMLHSLARLYIAPPPPLTKEMQTQINHLSAQLMHLTGGHPDCFAALLKKYKATSASPEEFWQNYRQDIETITTEKIGQVRNDIPADLQLLMDTISPCRRFTPKFLRKLMNSDLLPSADEYNLVDELTNSFLVTRKEGFFQDYITGRLLAIRLRQAEPSRFIKICQAARDTYADYLPQSTTNRPDIVALELLYQELQLGYYQLRGDTLQECDLEERAQLAEKFFETILPNHIQALATGRNKADIIARFLDIAEKDIEFQFILNYFLRTESYDDDPYQTLKMELGVRN